MALSDYGSIMKAVPTLQWKSPARLDLAHSLFLDLQAGHSLRHLICTTPRVLNVHGNLDLAACMTERTFTIHSARLVERLENGSASEHESVFDA